METLYKRDSKGILHYHEAWVNESALVMHWGPVGETGETLTRELPSGTEVAEALRVVLDPAVEKGYAPIEFEQMEALLIEYVVDGFGSEANLTKRHALQDRLNETLGWTGLGNCDGGSAGSGTMDVCCFVVDFDIAKRVIEADLRGTEYSNFTRICREDVGG